MKKYNTSGKKVKNLIQKKRDIEIQLAREMKPKIKILFLERGIAAVDIARALKVNPSLIANVISGRTYSKRVEQEIARRIGRSRKSLFGR